MSDNLYAAPRANLDRPVTQAEIPADILKKIKYAVGAGLVTGAFTLVITLIAISGNSLLGFSAWSMIDVVLVFGLTFGIFKKSRTCAILMLIYYVLSKIYLMVESGNPSGWIMSLAFGYLCLMGVFGTFDYHSLQRAHAAKMSRTG